MVHVRKMKEFQWFYLVERHNVATSVEKKNPVKKTASKKAVVSIPEVPVVKSAPKKRASVRPKPVTMVEKLEEQLPIVISEEIKKSPLTEKKLATVLAGVIAFTAFVTFGITHSIDANANKSNATSSTTYLAKISGGVALTEPELRDVVKQLKRTVFWVGPLKNARYTINALTDGQTYIRYLPNGDGVSDTKPNYRTVGTYQAADAYAATLAAGNEANGVSYTTTDGRVIHYNKSSEGNVYIAYKGKPFQIEIFDPKNGTALDIANANGLQVIK